MTIRIKKLNNKESEFKKIITKNLSEKVKDESFAKQLYASLCNTIWYNKNTEDIYSCTWRYAGGLVAEMRCKGENYLDFYCSGGEGCYHAEVYKELKNLGYEAIEYKQCNSLEEHFFK